MDKNKEKNYKELINKSIFFLKKNDQNSAKDFLKEAINLDSKKTLAYINLSNIYILENNLKASIRILNDYLESFNFNLEIVNHLGKIYINLDLVDQLINLKNKLTKSNNLKKDLYYIYYLSGIANERKENILKAVKDYKISTRYNKSFIESYLNLCNLLEKTNKIKELEKTIKLANKNCNTDPRISFFTSLLHYRKKEYHSSQSILDKEHSDYSQ